MNIVNRKLIYNEADIHLISWEGKPCFIVSEITKALDGISKKDISLFLRKNKASIKGTDYDVLQEEESRRLRSLLEESGVTKRFAKVTLIYFSGLRKYFEFRRIIQVMDFSSYLISSKVDLDDDEEHQEATPSPEASNSCLETPVQKPVAKAAKEKVDNISYNGYSEFYKHIAFMEEFVNSINKLNISPDKAIAFTVDMTKFLEDNGLPPQKLLAKIKKWV